MIYDDNTMDVEVDGKIVRRAIDYLNVDHEYRSYRPEFAIGNYVPVLHPGERLVRIIGKLIPIIIRKQDA